MRSPQAVSPGPSGAGRNALTPRYQTTILVATVLLISAIGWWRFIEPSFPFTYDGDIHVARALHLEQELKHGQFPVRWGSDQWWGYGYPTFNFYYPLPYYLLAGMHAAGLPATTAQELMLAISIAFGAVFMALWARSIWGVTGGVLAGMLYGLSPPLLQASFLIMTPGEVIVVALLPAIAWILHRAQSSTRPLTWLLGGGILCACTVLSHNFLGALALAVILANGIVLSVARRRWTPTMQTIGVITCGLILSATFWLPGYVELQYTQPKEAKVRFEPVTELLDLRPGPRYERVSSIVTNAHARDTIGAANLLALAIGSVSVWLFRGRLSRLQRTYLASAVIGFCALLALMLTPGRSELWDALPVLKQAQYSARMLTVVAFPAAIAVGSVTLWSWSRPLLIGLIALLSVGYGFAFAQPVNVQRAGDEYFLANQPLMRGTADWDHTVLPKWAVFTPRAPLLDPEPMLMPPGGRIERFERRSVQARAVVETPVDAALTVPIFYFPGWRAWVDGVERPLAYSEGEPVVANVQTTQPSGGSLTVQVPSGRHEVEFRFTNTPIRTAGNLLSLIGAAALAITLVVSLLWKRGTV